MHLSEMEKVEVGDLYKRLARTLLEIIKPATELQVRIWGLDGD